MESKRFNVLVDKIQISRTSKHGMGDRFPEVKRKKLDISSTREKLGVNQAEFAKILGVSQKTLEYWEKGKKEPARPTLLLLRVADRWPEAFIDSLLDY